VQCQERDSRGHNAHTVPLIMANAQSIIDHLKLEPLTFEGGYFRRTLESEDILPGNVLPERYGGKDKLLYSAIYFLLTSDTHSKLHRLPTDEVFHFYLGDPVEMLQLGPDGSARVAIIGNRVLENQSPQVCVPKYAWQGCQLVEGGDFALMGVTLSPGFDDEDFEVPADVDQLLKQYPAAYHHIIRDLM
jgi:predicted cupin superfamily sugar epimerase